MLVQRRQKRRCGMRQGCLATARLLDLFIHILDHLFSALAPAQLNVSLRGQLLQRSFCALGIHTVHVLCKLELMLHEVAVGEFSRFVFLQFWYWVCFSHELFEAFDHGSFGDAVERDDSCGVWDTKTEAGSTYLQAFPYALD